MGILAVSGETLLNGPGYDISFDPAIAALKDDRYVVTWTGGTSSGFVRGALVTGNGTKINEFAVAEMPEPTAPAAAVMATGMLVFATTNGAPQVTRAHPNAVILPQAPVATDSAGTTTEVAVTALTGGEYVVAWESWNRPGLNDGSGSSILARIFNAANEPVGRDFVANGVGTGNQLSPVLAGLSGGGFVAAWTSYENGGSSPGVVRARVFAAEGQARPEITIESGRWTGGLDVAGLSDGGFVAVWQAEVRGVGGTVQARIFDGLGRARGAAFEVSDVDADSDHDPAVALLDDGRLVVVWHDGDMKARLFDESGTALGSEFRLSTDDAAADVSALADGRFAVAWTETVRTVRTAVFDPREYEGTRGSDRWSGGDAKDRISGLGGDDVLFGRGGNDRIAGGSGIDRLSGWRGTDVLDGGADADVLTGGDDGDRFLFGSAAQARGDRVADFASGEDRLDLSAIDARADRPGDQAFVYIRGRDFSGRPGELRLEVELLAGDTDGDGRADFAIRLNGVETLRAADLVL